MNYEYFLLKRILPFKRGLVSQMDAVVNLYISMKQQVSFPSLYKAVLSFIYVWAAQVSTAAHE